MMINRETEQAETVVHINRVAKVVKGGKNFSFSAVVVAGDGEGMVGYGTGKAREVPPAIQKASEQARRYMIRVPMVGGTVPHLVWGRWGGTRVLLRPASPGTGVIAGSGVRAVMESAGIQDVLTKIVGSRNPFNVVRATFNALGQLTTAEEVARLRGVDVCGASAESAPPAAADSPVDVAAEVAAPVKEAVGEAPVEEAVGEAPVEEAVSEESAEPAAPTEETVAEKPADLAADAAVEEVSEDTAKEGGAS